MVIRHFFLKEFKTTYIRLNYYYQLACVSFNTYILSLDLHIEYFPLIAALQDFTPANRPKTRAMFRAVSELY